MENLVFEPDASGGCLKRRRLDDVRFLADAVQALPAKRGAHAVLMIAKLRTGPVAGCQSQAPDFELSAPAGTGRKGLLSSSKRKLQEEKRNDA